jgi:phosphatidylinositol kinase/protein kinase (PI-3  family)
MDLQMTLYRVVATGENSGMIEVVPNSVTTATIQKVIHKHDQRFQL